MNNTDIGTINPYYPKTNIGSSNTDQGCSKPDLGETNPYLDNKWFDISWKSLGSAKCLIKRFIIYYYKSSQGRSWSAIFKYDYYNSSLDIIEDCLTPSLIEREQYYIDILKPEYTLLKVAYTRLGLKDSKKTNNLINNTTTRRKH